MKPELVKLDPLERAEQFGYRAGLEDIQTCRQNYQDSDKLIAWFTGWRRGQLEHFAPLAAELGITVDQARRMDRGILQVRLAAARDRARRAVRRAA